MSAVVTEPGVADGTTTFYFGDTFGDDHASCLAACEAQAGCYAYTLYTTSFYEEEWRGHCYGRISAVGGITTRGSADVVRSGIRQELCERLSVTENVAIPTTVSTSALAATDQDGDSVSFAIVSGNTGAAFTVDGSNDIATAGAIDYESTPQYLLTVRATDDNAAGAAYSDVVLLVQVVNVNESPVLPDSTLNVRKASVNGEEVGGALRGTDPEGLAVTHVITDGTKTAGPGDAVTSANVNTLFNIDSSTGQITIADETMFATYDETSQFQLTVVATDASPDAKSTTATITVDVLEGNAAPVVASGQTFSVPELASVGTAVGTVVATDPDGDALTYTMRRDTTDGLMTYFEMSSAVGAITVKVRARGAAPCATRLVCDMLCLLG